MTPGDLLRLLRPSGFVGLANLYSSSSPLPECSPGSCFFPRGPELKVRQGQTVGWRVTASTASTFKNDWLMVSHLITAPLLISQWLRSV